MIKPQELVPDSNMPSYPWLAETAIDGELVARKMRALQRLGDPYSDEQIEGAADVVADKSELDALVAYLQNLGTVRSAR
jgi:cytochrome c oxidase cbb3-type subunit 2